jgi:hypothetical protein
MASFIDAATSYPTAVYTVLLGVVMVYWLLALVGVFDLNGDGGIDLDLHADGNVDDLGALAGFVVAFGLSGVPVSIALGLLVVVSWTLCCLAGMWVLPLVPTALLHVVAGTLLLAVSFAAALPVTAVALRPLRGLFKTHRAVSNASLVGQRCKVLSGRVTPGFGHAEVPRRGASLNIDVGAHEPNDLVRGSAAIITGYDPDTGRYLIEAEP